MQFRGTTERALAAGALVVCSILIPVILLWPGSRLHELLGVSQAVVMATYAAALPVVLVIMLWWPKRTLPKNVVSYNIYGSTGRREAVTRRGRARAILCTVKSFTFTAGQFDNTFTVKVSLRPIRPADIASGESREFEVKGLDYRSFGILAELCRKQAPHDRMSTVEVDCVLDASGNVIGIGNPLMSRLFLKPPLS